MMPTIKPSRTRPTSRPRTVLGLEPLEERAVPAVIGGTVYADINANGLFNPGEQPIVNNTIQLENSSGTVIATTTTDSNGQYRFTVDQTIDTSPHTKTVSATLGPMPTDTVQTLALSQFDPRLGQLTGVDVIVNGTLTSEAKVENLGSSPANVDAELTGDLTITGPGGAHVTVHSVGNPQGTAGAFDGQADLQGNDTWDSGKLQFQAPQQSVSLSAGLNDLSGFVGTGSVNLTASSTATGCGCGAGNLLAMIRSVESGNVQIVYHYTPSNSLQPGTYTVVQPNVPPGYVTGLKTNDNVTPIPGSQNVDYIHVNLGTGDSTQNNFAELQPANLSGFVYNDVKHLGSFGTGDLPIPGVKITLTGHDVYGGSVTRAPVQTGPNGAYSFANLLPGQYLITETQPGGFINATNNLGSLGGQVSGDTFTVGASQGQNGVNYNFGEQQIPIPPPPPPQIQPPPVSPPPPAPGGLPDIKLILIGGGWGGWGW